MKPMVITAESTGSTLRVTIVCSAMTICAADHERVGAEMRVRRVRRPWP